MRKNGSDKMNVSLNGKQKIGIVAIIISMSIIAVLLSKLINHEDSKTVTKIPDITDSQDMPPKETSIPESTEHKEIPEAQGNNKSFSDYVESYISSTAKKEEMELELELEKPILKIKDDSDIFKPWGKIHKGSQRIFPVRIDDNNKTIWGMGSEGTIITEKIIKHDNEGFNIEGMNKALKDKGISIADCDVKFISDSYYNEGENLVFKVFDSNKENLFLLKDNNLINLSNYGVSFFYNDVYSVKENKTNYICRFNEKNNTIEKYIVPFELERIELAYIPINNIRQVFIVAKKIGEENLSYFKINIVYRSIVEFKTIKHLSDIYQQKFSFKSDVLYNKIVEEIGDVYIIDGRRDRDYFLFFVNKHTGKKIWSFYGDYIENPYHITKDEKHITILNRIEGYGKCYEIQTGKVIWEDKFPIYSDGYDSKYSFNEFGKVFIVECNKKLVAINKDNWKNIWNIGVPEISSNQLIYKFSEDERYVYYFDENSFMMKCIEINSGKILWKKGIDSSSILDEPYNNYFSINELFIIFSEKRIIAFNTADGSIAWEREFEKEVGTQYEYYSGRIDKVSIHNDIFILIYRDNLIAIDTEDGEVLWDKPINKSMNSYDFYRTMFNGKEILVLYETNDIYVIDVETGDIINEFHEKIIANNTHKVELKDNILYLYSYPSSTNGICINIDTGEINDLPDNNDQEDIDDILKESLSDKILYDGISVFFYDNSLSDSYIEAKDENGYVKWAFSFNNPDSYYSNSSHSPKRIKNKVYININGAIVCVDALSGKKLYQLGKYESLNSQIVKLSDGTYWAHGNNGYFDVYKID